jgi:type I restriction enzyme M protein
VDTFTRQVDVPRYARTVGFEEIEKNDFNLNIPRYIDSEILEDIQDIEAHLNGGIPNADVDAIADYWAVLPGLRETLFSANRPGYMDVAVENFAIQSAIYEHPELKIFIAAAGAHFTDWRERAAATLKALGSGCHPKVVIESLSEDLLAHYATAPLIDQYDVYQRLMDYWAETMQDDLYLIAADGWKAEISRLVVTDKKTGQEKVKGWTCDLVPKSLMVAHYYAKEQSAIDARTAQLEATSATLTEIEDENGGEEGAFTELDALNKAQVQRRLKEIAGDRGAGDEARTLSKWLKLTEVQADTKKWIRDADSHLDAKVYAHYAALTESEVQTLVTDEKWLGALSGVMHEEIENVGRRLTQRVSELADRYDRPLPVTARLTADHEAKVERDLVQMGFAWR